MTIELLPTSDDPNPTIGHLAVREKINELAKHANTDGWQTVLQQDITGATGTFPLTIGGGGFKDVEVRLIGCTVDIACYLTLQALNVATGAATPTVIIAASIAATQLFDGTLTIEDFGQDYGMYTNYSNRADSDADMTLGQTAGGGFGGSGAGTALVNFGTWRCKGGIAELIFGLSNSASVTAGQLEVRVR